MTGESLTVAITVFLRERLERLHRNSCGRDLVGELDEIALRCAALPVLEQRDEEEILGYDGRGLPA